MKEQSDGKAQDFKVAKQDYSRGAWRVLNQAGEQVYRSELYDHPMLGLTRIHGPVCFDRKCDAVAWVESQPTSTPPESRAT